MFSVIAKACPHWVDEDLWHGFTTPVHDNNFTTIFANLPFIGISTSGTIYSYQGSAANDYSTEVNYQSYTNNLDGAAYALTGMYIGTSFTPSLFKPFASSSSAVSTTSRISWAHDGTSAKWIDVFANTTVAIKVLLSRGETVVYSSWNSYNDAMLNFGCEIVYGVSANTVSQTALEVVDWLLSLDSMRSNNKRGSR